MLFVLCSFTYRNQASNSTCLRVILLSCRKEGGLFLKLHFWHYAQITYDSENTVQQSSSRSQSFFLLLVFAD